MLAGCTLDGICSVFCSWWPSTPLVVLVVHLFIDHGLVGQFYLVFASLRPSLAPLSKGQRIRPLFTLEMMVVILSFVLAALGPALASLHEPIHGSLELHSGRFLELLCLLHDGLFIFAALGPAPAAVFLIIIIGGFLIILFNSLLVRLMKIAGVVLFILTRVTFSLAIIIELILRLLKLLDLLDDGSVLVMRYVHLIILLTALDL